MVPAALRPAGVRPAIHRIGRVTSAFMWLGVTETIAYPLMLITSFVLGPASAPVIYRFVSRLVESGANVGFDYFTFVVIGFFATIALNGGLTGFSGALGSAIQQGRIETFLVQPVSWYSLPFALGAWPIVLDMMNALIVVFVGMLLGARVEIDRVPAALIVLGLGIASSHAIGTLAASVRLLSKKADPVVSIYRLFVSIVSGAFFPVTLLPGFIQPIALVLPHTYVLTALRRLLMEQGDVMGGPSLGTSILVLGASTIVLYAIALFAFGRSLHFGREYGVLSGY